MELLFKEHNSRLSRENQELQEELHLTRQQLLGQSKRIPDYEVTLGKSQKKCSELLAQLDQEKERALKAQATYNSREVKYTRQEELLRSLQVDLDATQRELRKLKLQLQTEESEKSTLIVRIEESRRAFELVDNQLQSAQTDAAKYQTEAQQLRAELEAAKRQSEMSVRQVESVRREIVDVKHAAELERKDWQAKVAREHDANKETIRSLKETIQTLQQTARMTAHTQVPTTMQYPVSVPQTILHTSTPGMSTQFVSQQPPMVSSYVTTTTTQPQPVTTQYSYGGPIPSTMTTSTPMTTVVPGMMVEAVPGWSTGAGDQYDGTHHHRHHHHSRSRSPSCERGSRNKLQSEYRKGFRDAVASPACVGGPGGGGIDSTSRRYSCIDAPNLRRPRKGIGALPVDRSLEGDLIATCRRRHCLRRFNVNDNAASMCGYHPVKPQTSYDGDFYSCCGVLVNPGAPNIYCQFRPHLA